jgi:hypothetical protein
MDVIVRFGYTLGEGGLTAMTATRLAPMVRKQPASLSCSASDEGHIYLKTLGTIDTQV